MNNIDIEKEHLIKLAGKMNKLLSSYAVYAQNVRTFHWNIEGQNFFQLHEVFEELYIDARERIDDIAERILTLGFKPMSKLTDYLEYSEIKEVNYNMEDREMMQSLVEMHRELINHIRETIKEASDKMDEGTVDLLSDMISTIEKRTWMLNAWLSSQKVASLN
ncbi:MAG: DNA starvation/stationary phase protection protein [Saprospiraceae bacterium]|nr:DNA starvation/stationary phase protection protein [Saprospiraceae bacterium]